MIYTPKFLITPGYIWYELEEQEKATEFLKKVFGEDFNQAVEDMYEREINEHREKWHDACKEMFKNNCKDIPKECNEIM